MKNPLLIAFAVFSLCVLGHGCKSSTNVVAPESGLGALSGTVRAYASNAPNLIDPSGITVTMKSKSDTLSTATNAQGSFSFATVPAGIYMVVFSKPGFDTVFYPDHHMFGMGSDIIDDAFLIKNQDDSVVIDQINLTRDSTIQFIQRNDTVYQYSTFLRLTGHIIGVDTAYNVSIGLSVSDTSSPSGSIGGTPLVSSTGTLVDSSYIVGQIKPSTVFFFRAQPSAITLNDIPGVAGSYSEYESFYSTPPPGKITWYRYVVK